MPLYDYQCEKCANTFEILLFSNKEKQNLCCPKCGNKKVHKLVSIFGVAGTEKKVSQTSCTNCSTKTCSTCK